MKNVNLILLIVAAVFFPIKIATAAEIYNTKYPHNEWESRWNVDLGQCNSEAISAYPTPPPVERPKVDISGLSGQFSGYSSSGESFHGTYRESNRIEIIGPQAYRDIEL